MAWGARNLISTQVRRPRRVRSLFSGQRYMLPGTARPRRACRTRRDAVGRPAPGERLRVARDASHVRLLQRDVEELRRAATRRRGDRLRLGRRHVRVRARPALGREPLRRVVGTRRVGRLRQRALVLHRPRDVGGGEFAIGAPPRPRVRATPSTQGIYTQAFSLPPWPEDKSPWRYLLRCRSSSLQDLSSSGTLLY